MRLDEGPWTARKLGRTAVLLQVERDGQRFFAGIPIED